MADLVRTVTVSTEDGDSVISYNPFPVSVNGDRLDLTQSRLLLPEKRESIRLDNLPAALREHVLAFISYLVAKQQSESSLQGFIGAIKRYLSVKGESDLVEDELKKAYRSVLTSKSVVPEVKSRLRTFYYWCVAEELPYFDEDFVDFHLKHMKLGSNPNKGLDVQIEIENRGPLTLRERKRFSEAMRTADMTQMSSVEKQGFIGLRFGQFYAARKIQCARTKVKHYGRDEKGRHYIDIPRAKQRGRGNVDQVRRRFMSNTLAAQVQILIDEIRAQCGPEVDISEHYLFYPLRSVPSALNQASSNFLRLTSGTYDYRVNAICEYLGLDFTVTNRRLRKTLCSKLVAEGKPMKVIASLLDQSDLQQLAVYYRQTKVTAKKLADVLKKEASEVVASFKGKVVSIDEKADEGQEIFARKCDGTLHLIGCCGSQDYCDLSPPMSCYGCDKMEAFEEVDHQSILDAFIEDTKKCFGEAHVIRVLEDECILAASALAQQQMGACYDDE